MMDETKEKIENFVNKAIKKNDFVLLDILWTFFYSIPSKTAYHHNEKEIRDGFNGWLVIICKRNLQKKYKLTEHFIKAVRKYLLQTSSYV